MVGHGCFVCRAGMLSAAKVLRFSSDGMVYTIRPGASRGCAVVDRAKLVILVKLVSASLLLALGTLGQRDERGLMIVSTFPDANDKCSLGKIK